MQRGYIVTSFLLSLHHQIIQMEISNIHIKHKNDYCIPVGTTLIHTGVVAGDKKLEFEVFGHKPERGYRTSNNGYQIIFIAPKVYEELKESNI